MKTAALCTSSSPSSAKASPSAVGKHRRPAGDHQGDEEMQACFARLMQLVPTVANNGRMSKVQLLQHVIDYILDLEYTLDFRPGKTAESADRAAEAGAVDGLRVGPGSPPPPATTATPGPSPPLAAAAVVVERKPLTENAQVNSAKGHQSAQQTSYFERQPSITWS